MTTLFARKTGNTTGSTPLSGLVGQISAHAAREFGSTRREALARSALSLESISHTEAQELGTVVGNLSTSLEQIASSMKLKVSEGQRDAAVAAAILAQAPKSFLSNPLRSNVAAAAGTTMVATEGFASDILTQRPSMEAYDETDNRNVVPFSVAYNMIASRQNPFAEAFFPTVVVSPDTVGLSVSVRLIQVMDDIKRGVEGTLNNFKKVNILKAAVDSTILRNDQTKVTPVHRAQAAAYFVDAADVAPAAVNVDGESITTAPLKLGARFSLLGISQSDAMIANGLNDVTDAIDPGIYLRNLYLKFGTGATADVVRLSTKSLPTASFAPAAQGLHRLMNLNFSSDSLLLTPDTKQVDGGALQTLTGLAGNGLAVRFRITVNGSVNLELGDTELTAGSLSVISVTDVATGNILDHTVAGAAKTAADALVAGAAIGYDLQAYRTNTNRRQRGQLLDTTWATQLYTVYPRSPITSLRPTNSDAQTENADLAALITATQLRTSAAAVTTLIETAAILDEMVLAKDTSGNYPDVLGVGRLLVKPTYITDSLDMSTAINSLTSAERARDMQATLVNKIRDMAYRLHRDSNLKTAREAMQGGMGVTETVVIGTDPVLARYLMVDGDFRTLGNDFNVEVVSTMDERVSGRIFIAFKSAADGKVDPLGFGNMAWKPELTLVLPVAARGGQISKELTVTPAFLHIVNTPVLGLLEVTNVPDVVTSAVAISIN